MIVSWTTLLVLGFVGFVVLAVVVLVFVRWANQQLKQPDDSEVE